MKKTLITAALFSAFAGSAVAQEKVVAGYFADWQYANASNPYTVKDIPAEKLTHVIYAFVVDTEAALEKDFGKVSVKVPFKGHFAQLAELKKQHPDLKILPSYPGGGGLTTSPWNPATKLSDEQKAAERDAFTYLVKTLRADLDALEKKTNREYELSTAVGVGAKAAQIDWKAAQPYLTNMFAMTYDFLGGWGQQTGHTTNL